MARKSLLFLFISIVCLLASTVTVAGEGLFGAGARFAWENFKKPVMIHEPGTATGLGGLDANDFGGPNFGGELQIRPIKRLSIGLSIDMGLSTHTVYPFRGQAPAGGDIESKATCFSFGFLLGGKFYVMEPQADKASLYVHLGAGKYIAKVSNSATKKMTDPVASEALEKQLEVISGLSAPIVVQLAVGAEYFLSDSFSLGADILGFRMGISKADVGDSVSAQYYSGEHKLFSFTVYSALTMNFGFGSSGKSKGKSNEDAGWGNSGGGEANGSAGADANASWGNSGGGEAAPANDGWGSAPADNGGDAGWGAAPAESAPADSGGWEAQPAAPAPAPANGGGGSKPRPKKAKPAPATPPPPPPGY